MPLLLVPEKDVSPGILGFTLVFALGLTLYFLIRSMNKHIGRIQAPREDDLKQAEWERRQARRKGGTGGSGEKGEAGGAAGTGEAAGDGESRQRGDSPHDSPRDSSRGDD